MPKFGALCLITCIALTRHIAAIPTASHIHCVGASLDAPTSTDDSAANAWTRSCRLHNVCLYRDKLVYVARDPDFSLPTPLVGLSGRAEQETLLSVDVVTATSMRNVDAVHLAGTHLLHQMSGANNPGHVLLESLVPLVALREMFGDDIVPPLYVLMQNRCNDPGLDQKRQGDGRKELCAGNVERYMGAVSTQPVRFVGDLKHPSKAVCFDTILAGTASLGQYQKSAPSHHFTLARQALRTKYGVVRVGQPETSGDDAGASVRVAQPGKGDAGASVRVAQPGKGDAGASVRVAQPGKGDAGASVRVAQPGKGDAGASVRVAQPGKGDAGSSVRVAQPGKGDAGASIRVAQPGKGDAGSSVHVVQPAQPVAAAVAASSPIHVVLHKKIGRRTLVNYDDVASWITDYRDARCRPCFNLTQIKLDDVPLPRQLRLFADTDVFVTPGGAAAFNALLLSPGSVLVTFPLCHVDYSTGGIMCETFEGGIIGNVPSVKTVMYPVDSALQGLSPKDGTQYNRDIVVDKTVFTSLLRQAVDHIVAERRWRRHGVSTAGRLHNPVVTVTRTNH